MEKIDRVEDLPEWFDLQKYQKAESFHAAQWLGHLSPRAHLWQMLKDNRNEQIPRSFKNPFREEWVEGPLEILRRAPLQDKLDKGGFAMNYEINAISLVQPLSIRELARQCRQDEWGASNGLCDSELASRWKLIPKPYDSLHDAANRVMASTPIEIGDHGNPGRERPALIIDLCAPDAEIKAAFSSWLKQVRAGQPEKSLPPKSYYRRWARYGLLPYLDLLIWSIETSTHIPDRVMSAAISRYDAGEANLRKTIAPLGAGLMRDLSGIRALAAIEAGAFLSADPEALES